MEELLKVRRRRFSRAQKVEILKDFDRGYSSCSELAEKHRISPVLIYRWRKAMVKEQGTDKEVLRCSELISDIEDKDKKIEHLQKALSDSVIENQILKKALEVVKKNTRLKKYGLRKKC